MAAGNEFGQIDLGGSGGTYQASFSSPAYSNGFNRESNLLGDSVPPSSMEDMLKEATDMQQNTTMFSSGRLELQSDDSVSPFGNPLPPPMATNQGTNLI